MALTAPVPPPTDPEPPRRFRKFLWKVPGFWRLHRAYHKWAGTDERIWFRIVMDDETKKLVDALPVNEMDALEISGGEWGQKGIEFQSFKAVFWPEYDVCEGPLDETFDIIFAEQIFEHLLWPYRAGKHVYEMLNPGGYFLVTTPFLVRLHPNPHDCSRWTETGLQYFLAECGFPLDNIVTGSWGNRKCMNANFWTTRRHWPKYQKRFHSLENEEGFPVAVWALAKK